MIKLEALKIALLHKFPKLSEDEVGEVIALVAVQLREELAGSSAGCCDTFPEYALFNGFNTPNAEGESPDWCSRCGKALEDITLLNKYIFPISL